MPNQGEINSYLERLEIYRRTLQVYLFQQAQIGTSFVAPQIIHGISDARENIKRIKETLTAWGVQYSIEADDEELKPGYRLLATQEPHSDEVFKGIINQQALEIAHTLLARAVKRMDTMPYSEEQIKAMQIIHHELIANAAQHGCTDRHTDFELEIYVTIAYTSIVVTNLSERTFDLGAIIQQKSQDIQRNPRARRGRGLILVSKLADTLGGAHNGKGVKAVLYQDEVKLETKTWRDNAVIRIHSGIRNPSITRRLFDLALEHQDKHIIIDAKGFFVSTEVGQVFFRIDQMLSNIGRHLVVLLDRQAYVSGLFPSDLIARSLEDAIRKVTGVSNADKQDSIKAGKCTICGYQGQARANYCSKCGSRIL